MTQISDAKKGILTEEMKHVATSVDEIEILTGINFFFNVPDKLEDQIEATYSLKLWK